MNEFQNCIEVQYMDDDNVMHLATLNDEREVNFINDRFTILLTRQTIRRNYID